MDSKEVRRNSIITIAARAINILLTFLITICITQFWGAEGKGLITLFSADLALITIGLNVLAGSSVAFFAKKIDVSKLHLQAVLWTFLVSFAGALFVYFFEEVNIAFLLFFASVPMGLYIFYSSLFIGEQKINQYNVMSVVQPVGLLLFLLLFRYTVEPTFYAYFYALICSLLVSGVISLFLAKRFKDILRFSFEWLALKKCMIYGLKEEFGHLLQFFVTRLGYYVLAFYSGNAAVGQFSVGVQISESILIISRSIAMVQYSKAIAEGHNKKTMHDNLKAALYSLLISLLCIVIVMFIPNSLFALIFGKEFVNVKEIVLILSPGVLIVSFANVLVHYFSGIGNLNISILKSAVGAVFTVILSFILIPKYFITGAGITSSAVYIISSLVIIIAFFNTKKKFEIS
jgi:O-antigen/teichoic acid export membrane protein